MDEKMDIYSGNKSYNAGGLSSNTGSLVVTCLIAFLICMVLLAAGGVHADSDPVVAEQANPVVTEVTPTPTPTPVEEVRVESEAPPEITESPASAPAEAIPTANDVTPILSETAPTNTPVEQGLADQSSQTPVIISPAETSEVTTEPTTASSTAEVTDMATEVPMTQPTTAVPTVVTTVPTIIPTTAEVTAVVTTIPTVIPTTANVTALPTEVPETTLLPTTPPVVETPTVNVTPEIPAPAISPVEQPLVAPQGNLTGTAAAEKNQTLLSPESVPVNTTSDLAGTADLTPGLNGNMTTPGATNPSGSNYTWSDPPLNTTLDNPYYLVDNQSWVINESGHDWVMDLNPANTTGRGITLSDNVFSGFGSQFAILINASNVIFDGMGAILDGSVNSTKYGIMVNNQNASNYDTFSSDPLAGISITNITLINFNIAGIFFNNVIGHESIFTPSNITNVQVNSSGNGIVLQNSQDIEVTNNHVYDNHQNGIALSGSNGNTLAGNNASDNTFNGIILTNSSSNIIFNNTVSGNTLNGIFLNSSSTQNNLTANTVNSNVQNGIVLSGVGFNNLTYNNVSGNQDGIVLQSAWNNTLTRNNASYNQYGINLTSSSNNTLDTNTVIHNSVYGILLVQ